MPVVQINSKDIHDWDSFHSVVKDVFGFPEFYGENMDAFIDCLTYIDEGDGMSNIVLKTGERLRIDLLSADDLKARMPEVFEALVEAIEAVNERSIEDGKTEKIELVML